LLTKIMKIGTVGLKTFLIVTNLILDQCRRQTR
jgi:hypothetical protein